ncbi:GumC family protein [Methylomagnum sp.]
MDNASTSHDQHNLINLRDLLTILFKRKHEIVIVFLIVMLGVISATLLIAPTYEAKSGLLVKFGREYMRDYANRPSDRDAPPVISQEDVINSEIQILTSPDLIEKVIDTLKIENIYPDLVDSPSSRITPAQAAAIKFMKNLKAEGIKNSTVIQVLFQHHDPAVAAQALNLLVESFREKHLQLFSEPTSSFLEKQLAVYEQKLKESEKNLETFKQQHQVFSFEEQMTLLLRQRTELDNSLKSALVRVEELQKRLFTLRRIAKNVLANKSFYTQSEREKIIVDARANLLDLQLKEKQLQAKYDESSPLIKHTREEIELVQQFLTEQDRDVSTKVKTGNIIYQEIEKDIVRTEAELSSQQANVAILSSLFTDQEGRIEALNKDEMELTNLKRAKDASEKNYLGYLERVESARISDDMNRQKMANISIIHAAAIPAEAIKPKKALNILVGLLLGVVAGLGFALLSEYSSKTISDPKHAETRLGLPVLATIAYKP